LRQAAERLEACAPTRAVAARPGGDEFVLVLPGADDMAAIAVASAVCRRMAVPFSLGGKEHFLGASIGIALAPMHGNNRTDLLRHADMAMYTAKDAGRGRHAMFEEPLDARLLERSALLADLRQAATRKELVLHYQPRVGVADGRIVSAEALIRWRHPTRGLLAPGVFIPLAEESDLIEVIGLWVIRAACAQLARWRREGVPLQRLSVNVSPRQLQSGRLMEDVEAALVQHGVPWNMLELEVTESLLVGDARLASEQLGRLRERGVLIALDDFGTGYSSMATLRNLPIDVMKVDRAFVQDLSDDPSALAVTRAILTLAQALGKHTVAEGIETQAQADTLRQLGCDEFQGFLFSKAVPAAEFAALCLFSAQQPLVTSG
jgi:predicted signal transduction protein with EAL and GGDEF domain